MTDEGRLIAGRYRLTQQVGRGGMGTVWRAQDEVLGRQVALKRIHVQPHLPEGELATLYERMRREARSAARIVHPNVVVVHDVVDDDGRPCIVMEYVPAVTLGDLLKDGQTIPPEEAVRIGLEMTAALRAAHAAGVLHRDVKPGNVMLGAEGRVVLTDFGIAMTSDVSTLTKTGEMVGSIQYMAPERIRGQKPGPASDLWALGATLYQAVEGRPPFHRPTVMESAYAVVVDPLEPMKHAGPLAPLIEALLSKDPDERPSAEQTERALRAARSRGSTESVGSDESAGPTGPTTVLPPEPAANPSSGPDSEAPARTSGGETAAVGPARTDGGRERRRGGKRRVLVATTVAVTAGAAAIAGTIYATSDHGTGTPGTGAVKTPGAATPSYTPAPVPKGFHRVSEIGASFPVPDGWKAVTRSGELVTFADKAGRGGLTVKMVEPAGSTPMAHFMDMEAITKGNYPSGYRRLRMQQTTFREQPAVVWEFTFKGKARVFRGIEQGFGQAGGREYDIYLSAPEAQWDAYRPIFDTCRDGFTAARH
ncbi:serine/threonine-protein kinase [Streptomyces sp. YGL11-2]|uniref:serine/threonine-protein kinase n=1 Tax=Streptomyces sp. YGL11-2 TaxID=3414028 RepID=UPI003CF76C47